MAGAALTEPARKPSTIERLFPIIGWARGYEKRDLPFDLRAGLTQATLAVPEGLAFAAMAGLPPAVGLYAGVAAMLTYAVFGTSRLLATGTTAVLAVMSAGTIGVLAAGHPAKAAVMATFATLVAGAAAFIGWICRLGFLANLVSRSVLTGFSAGAGLLIASTQLPKLFGVKEAQGQFPARMASFFAELPHTNGWTLGLGLAALALIIAGKRLLPRWPSALIVIVVALAAAPFLSASDHGVKVLGLLPAGLPEPALPLGALSHWRDLVPLGLSLFVLSYVEGVSVARTLSARGGGRIDSGQELLATAAGNLVSGMFHGMAVGGGLTRSRVAADIGTRSPLASAAGGMLLLIVVAFLSDLFAALPYAILAAVVLVAAADLIDLRTLARIFALSRREFGVAVITGVGVLLFGMLWGVAIGVVVSLLDLLERTTFPQVAVLGRVPGTNAFADRQRNPQNEAIAGLLILRTDASVVFANAHTIKLAIVDKIEDEMAAARPVHLLVLDLEASPLFDLSGAQMLDELRSDLERRGIALRVAGANASVRGLLRAEAPEPFTNLEPGIDVSTAVRTWLSQHPSGLGAH